MKHHPEQMADEIFLGNATNENYQQEIGWKTKRKGLKAYQQDGSPMDKYSAAALKPVFIKRSEVEDVLRKETDSFNRLCYQNLLDNGGA